MDPLTPIEDWKSKYAEQVAEELKALGVSEASLTSDEIESLAGLLVGAALGPGALLAAIVLAFVKVGVASHLATKACSRALKKVGPPPFTAKDGFVVHDSPDGCDSVMVHWYEEQDGRVRWEYTVMNLCDTPITSMTLVFGQDVSELKMRGKLWRRGATTAKRHWHRIDEAHPNIATFQLDTRFSTFAAEKGEQFSASFHVDGDGAELGRVDAVFDRGAGHEYPDQNNLVVPGPVVAAARVSVNPVAIDALLAAGKTIDALDLLNASPLGLAGVSSTDAAALGRIGISTNGEALAAGLGILIPRAHSERAEGLADDSSEVDPAALLEEFRERTGETEA